MKRGIFFINADYSSVFHKKQTVYESDVLRQIKTYFIYSILLGILRKLREILYV
jgi:hypothetical protein